MFLTAVEKVPERHVEDAGAERTASHSGTPGLSGALANRERITLIVYEQDLAPTKRTLKALEQILPRDVRRRPAAPDSTRRLALVDHHSESFHPKLVLDTHMGAVELESRPRASVRELLASER